jgi:hypothetical protein
MNASRTAAMGLPTNYGKVTKIQIPAQELRELITNKERSLSWKSDLVKTEIESTKFDTLESRIEFKSLLGKETHINNSINRLARMRVQSDKTTKKTRTIRVNDYNFLRNGDK